MRRMLRMTVGLAIAVSILCMGRSGQPSDPSHEPFAVLSAESLGDVLPMSRQLDGVSELDGEWGSVPASVTVADDRPDPSSVGSGTYSSDTYGAQGAGTSVVDVEPGNLGIPDIVLQAYQEAAATWSQRQPACRLRWQVLAGIGKVESSHARGGQVTASGDTQPRILGPELSGGPGVAAISDTDGGRWDGDAVWDRAVGPMQFIPGTWSGFGVDATGDGLADPHNLFDSTLAAANYLCYSGADLSTDSGLDAALLRYNNSTAYVLKVRGWIDAYDRGAASSYAAAGPGPASAGPVSPAGGSSGAGSSNDPSPKPSEKPKPTKDPKPEPTKDPKPEPTKDPEPDPSVSATATSEPSDPPKPTDDPTPEPTDDPDPEPEPTESQEPTDEPEPTDQPEPTVSPEPTDDPTPEPTDEPEPTESPKCPEPSDGPDAESPEPTAASKKAGESADPEATTEQDDPDSSECPDPTASPEPTGSAQPTSSPEGAEPTQTPEGTGTPDPTGSPDHSPTPDPATLPGDSPRRQQSRRP